MIYHTFSFNNLPAHQLLPPLIKFLHARTQPSVPWHVCWLNNEGDAVVGLLPKQSWTAYQSIETLEATTSKSTSFNIEILKTSRQEHFSSNVVAAPVFDGPTQPHLINHCYETYAIGYKAWIEQLIDYYQQHAVSDKTTTQTEAQNSEASATYQSGLMGFIGYDISAKALSPSSEVALAIQPCAFLAHYDIYLKPCSSGEGWDLHYNNDTVSDNIGLPEVVCALLNTVVYYLHSFEQQLRSVLKPPAQMPALPLSPLWGEKHYTQAFYKTQQYLHQGDSYQINLTQKWQGQLAKPIANQAPKTDLISAPRLIDYLVDLHQNTHAPFAGYLGISPRVNGKNEASAPCNINSCKTNPEFELLSCSPELFVLFNKNEQGKPQVITKPIKGTLPRGTISQQDEQLKQQLALSEKDQAENVMIVDLLRNDLGRFAEVGSVQVPKLFAIESFSNVHHMVSTVKATLKNEHHPLTVLFNSLPAGSITGAPKKRAVELISELEVGPRGAYCGTLGFMNFDGTGQWNVLIRSLQAASEGEVSLWAGGGITISSECTAEYQECLDKVGNLVAVLNPT